ncbi:hypothetical protein ACFL2D_01220 [Patescibacteria group bacterium]
MIPKDLAAYVAHAMAAHIEHAKEPGKEVRGWDRKTPSAIHPVWCAMTILTETRLSEGHRMACAKTLLFHDVKRDTHADLPDYLDSTTLGILQELTFHDAIEETEQIWKRSSAARLCKLYDLVSNFLDDEWVNPLSKFTFKQYTRRLTENIEEEYGPLNITRIARSLLD